MPGKVNTFTLSNGLRIVHQQDNATAMVALTLLYNVGGRDEDPELTGLAHLMEHLMFSGSTNVPDFDGALQQAGGMSNAWTSNDFTCFFLIVPAVNIETAMHIESDRMLAPAFSQQRLDIQRSVVIEEFKQQCLNRPYGDLSHHLGRLAYMVHPYQWPVIGKTPEHLERVTLGDVTDFYNRFYTPSNAVLSIVGNISYDDCRELCEKWFGEIPARRSPKRQLPVEPMPQEPRELCVEAQVPQTIITVAYPMAPYGTDDFYAADAITDVLSNGKSSRFARLLLTTQGVLSELDASIQGSEEPGLLMLTMRLSDNSLQTEERALEIVNAEIKRLLAGGVSEHELERAKNKYESQHTFSNLHYAQRSANLAMTVMHGERPGEVVERYRAQTVDSINEAARRIFRPERQLTLRYRAMLAPQD